MSARAEDLKQEASQTLGDTSKIESHVEKLSGSSRRERQQSAAVLAEVARLDGSVLIPYGKSLIDALDLPEAQTRWEALDALTELCVYDARVCEKALLGAENALFDETSGPLRLSAMRFLCRFGATTENRSEKVWGLIDEGIQCYHGDLEFNEMLLALIDFSTGKLAPEVRDAFADRMRFDSTNGKGMLQKRASQIEENLSAEN